MTVSQETADRIQNFASQRQKAEDEYDSKPLSLAMLQSYSRALDDTLRELQDQVKRQEEELQKVRPSWVKFSAKRKSGKQGGIKEDH